MDSELLTSWVNRLKLPDTDLQSLSFCRLSEAASVEAWVNELPVTRPTSTSVLLYRALPEVSRLKTSPENRLAILETLRPCVHQCIDGLSRQFLDQPLLMSEQAMKIAVIAQALQKHMSNGYCQVAKAMALDITHDTEAPWLDDLCLALHRGISSIGLQYLRHSQIYSSASSRLWLELNVLYRIAEHGRLLSKRCPDQTLKHKYLTSIQQAYVRIVMLACASPSQLQQQEIKRLYDALEYWSELCRLYPVKSNTDSRDIFVIDIDSHFPPSYRSQWSDDERPSSLREIKLSAIVNGLEELVDPETEQRLHYPTFLSRRLAPYLIQKWGYEQLRQDPRQSGQGSLETVVGLTAVHYHVSGGKTFENFLHQCGETPVKKNRFISHEHSSETDPWADAPDAEKMRSTSEDQEFNYRARGDNVPMSERERFQPSSTQVIDQSAKGFCLEWNHKIPQQAKAGEIIAVRTSADQAWSLGIIRWLKQHLNTSQIGLELITSDAHAIALRQRRKSGQDNVFMRGFVAQQVLKYPSASALITAAVPFRSHDRIMAISPNDSASLELTDQLLASSCINAFIYRPIDDRLPSGDWETVLWNS